MTDRMLGRAHPSWCPSCRAPAGPDCPDTGKSTREAKRAEKQRVDRLLDEMVRESAELGLYDLDPAVCGCGRAEPCRHCA